MFHPDDRILIIAKPFQSSNFGLYKQSHFLILFCRDPQPLNKQLGNRDPNLIQIKQRQFLHIKTKLNFHLSFFHFLLLRHQCLYRLPIIYYLTFRYDVLIADIAYDYLFYFGLYCLEGVFVLV